MKFEEKLMSLRKSKGWSQEDLANQIGVSRQTISKWESSQTTPEMNKLIELSKIFEISVDELINDVKEEQNEEKETKVYTKINLKPTNILVIIACVLTIIGLIFSSILYQKNKQEIYVEDIVMITYTIKMQDTVSLIEIYSFNNNDECIGVKKYVQAINKDDYEQWIKDVNKKSKPNLDLRYNIILNNEENEIIWSEKIYETSSRESIIKDRKTSLKNSTNLKITNM